METRPKFAPDVVLTNWRKLMAALPKMNERELKKALDSELDGAKRKDFINRLHRKYTKLKREREMQEMLQ